MPKDTQENFISLVKQVKCEQTELMVIKICKNLPESQNPHLKWTRKSTLPRVSSVKYIQIAILLNELTLDLLHLSVKKMEISH